MKQRDRVVCAFFIIATLVLSYVFFARNAYAEPPPVGSEQYEVLHPYADYLKTWQQSGDRGYALRCCDISDCRMVDVRTRDGHYQAYIAQSEFGPNAPNDWVDVPRGIADTDADPRRPPFPVACWSATRKLWDNGFYCFSPGTGM